MNVFILLFGSEIASGIKPSFLSCAELEVWLATFNQGVV